MDKMKVTDCVQIHLIYIIFVENVMVFYTFCDCFRHTFNQSRSVYNAYFPTIF